MKKVKSFLEKDIDLSILIGLTAAVLLIAAFVFGSSIYSVRNIQSMAFQIPEELFQRIKRHLEHESARLGRKVTQREFVLGLIEQALAEAEASLAPQEAPESTEEAPEDSGAAGTTPDASEASTEAERDTADIEQ